MDKREIIEDIAKKHHTCTCGEMYTSRKLVSPDCILCNADFESVAIDFAQHIASEKWISVEDELPELRKPVLVYMSYGKQDTCYWTGGLWVQSIRAEHSNGGVTHWQSLPPSPNK